MAESDISVNFHFGGVRLMNSAENSIKEKIPYSVILNEDIVYSFTVFPPVTEKKPVRGRMAEYKKIDLDGKGSYNLIVLNEKTKEEIKRVIWVNKVLWIHFNYAIYPDNHELKDQEGIQIEINESPQKYR